MSSIFMLVYTSQFSKPMSDEEIQEILSVSKKNNGRDQITGFLTVRDGYFLQLLEGPEDKVKACQKRISADPRHKNMVIQGEAHSEVRFIPDWSMGLIKAQEKLKSSETILKIFELGRAGKTFTDSQTLLGLLKLFSKEVEAVAKA